MGRAGRMPSLTLRRERACDSASSRESAWVTDTVLICSSQIKGNAASTRGGVPKNLQTRVRKQIVSPTATAQRGRRTTTATRGGRTTTALRVAGDRQRYLCINNFYNNAASVELDFNAYLSGMADELINPKYWPRHVPETRDQSYLGSLPDGGIDSHSYVNIIDQPVSLGESITSLASSLC